MTGEKTYNLTNKNSNDYIIIPNLEPNPKFKGRFTINGDLIDRGSQMESCFYSVMSLLEQKNNKIDYLLGNHEENILDSNCSDNMKIFNGLNFITYKNTIFNDENRDINKINKLSDENLKLYEIMRNKIIDAIKNDKIKCCLSEDNIIMSHVMFNTNSFYELILRPIYRDLKVENFLGINLIILDKLIQKVYDNKENLNKKDIKFLTVFINKFIKFYCSSGKKFNDKSVDVVVAVGMLTAERSLNKNNLRPLNGIKQIVGHDNIKEGIPALQKDNRVLYADCEQSEGYFKDRGEKELNTQARVLISDKKGSYKLHGLQINHSKLIQYHKEALNQIDDNTSNTLDYIVNYKPSFSERKLKFSVTGSNFKTLAKQILDYSKPMKDISFYNKSLPEHYQFDTMKIVLAYKYSLTNNISILPEQEKLLFNKNINIKELNKICKNFNISQDIKKNIFKSLSNYIKSEKKDLETLLQNSTILDKKKQKLYKKSEK